METEKTLLEEIENDLISLTAGASKGSKISMACFLERLRLKHPKEGITPEYLVNTLVRYAQVNKIELFISAKEVK